MNAGVDELETALRGIHNLLDQQQEDQEQMKKEINLKFAKVCDKLEDAKEDLEMLQISRDEFVHTIVDNIALTSSEHGESSVNPCIKQADKASPSGFYWTQNAIGHPVPVYCDMDRVCCGESGAWMRVAHIDMTDSTHSCPHGFRETNTGPRRCHSGGGCKSVIFPLHGIEYRKVCGRIIGYQYGNPGAFHGGTNSIEESYVDGISITHGGPSCNRKHIWTFAAATDEENSDRSRCPCSRIDNEFTGSVPEYVGDHYFCDSGTRTFTFPRRFYSEDPLWDGMGCGITSACCQFNTPPWFCRELSEPITDDIEVRLCHGSSRYDIVYFELIELYVK